MKEYVCGLSALEAFLKDLYEATYKYESLKKNTNDKVRTHINIDKEDERGKEKEEYHNNLANILKRYREDAKESQSKESYEGFSMENMENHAGVILTYIIPELDKNDISISVVESLVHVKSDKKIPFFGNLDSKVKMKFDIDFDRTRSVMKNGVLKVYIYKTIREEEKERKIVIQ